MPQAVNSVVDLEHLARYTGGDRDLNAEIMKLFDGQATELVAQLKTILAARDAKSWKMVTHTLKGAARGIGAFAMGDAAAKCEPIDLDDQAHASDAIAALENRALDVQAFIKTYLAG
jgi:HPt (histidine-containing phosphotransfer) domain-containing protein